MKDFFRFLKWQWQKFETWQKMYMLSAFIIGLGFGAGKPYGHYFSLAGFSIMFGYALKWFMWEPMIKSWENYKKEKTNLFQTIKTSDQK